MGRSVSRARGGGTLGGRRCSCDSRRRGLLDRCSGTMRRHLPAMTEPWRLRPRNPASGSTARRCGGSWANLRKRKRTTIGACRSIGRTRSRILNRTELRVQTAQHNHLAELERLVSRGFSSWSAEVPIRYALAKEYEDLGEYTASWNHLSVGAALRRRHLQYDPATDLATVDWLIESFPANQSRLPGDDSGRPIFIRRYAAHGIHAGGPNSWQPRAGPFSRRARRFRQCGRGSSEAGTRP